MMLKAVCQFFQYHKIFSIQLDKKSINYRHSLHALVSRDILVVKLPDKYIPYLLLDPACRSTAHTWACQTCYCLSQRISGIDWLINNWSSIFLCESINSSTRVNGQRITFGTAAADLKQWDNHVIQLSISSTISFVHCAHVTAFQTPKLHWIYS